MKTLFTRKKPDPNTVFLQAAGAGQLDKIQKYLDSGTVRDINTSEANGLNALHLAAQGGHVEVVRELLKKGAIVDAVTKKESTALHIASLAGQEEVLRLLIQHGAFINVQSQKGFTPLYMAAQENHFGCVKYLLSKGGDQRLATKDGFSPLAVAMQKGHNKVVTLLRENDTREDNVKAATLLLQTTAFLQAANAGLLGKIQEYLDSGTVRDINTSNANGLKALHLAAKGGHVEVVRELLKKGAIVDAVTKKENTALHIASLAGQEEVVRLLIQHGAFINVQSQKGFTPLYMAAQENHFGCVKYLLSKGGDQTLATKDGFTPLTVAMQQRHNKVVTLLRENDTREKIRLPALHIAAKKDDVKAATLLLQNDHNPDVTSKYGFTPLHIAAHYGNDKVASLLYYKGADVNYTAINSITPLHVASKWGKINMVSLLVAKGANIRAKTRDGLTPLHCAARSGHDQVVDVLLENGAPMFAKTQNGLTPLHLCAQEDRGPIAQLLLRAGAASDPRTTSNYTPLHVACHHGHVNMVKLLIDHGADVNSVTNAGYTPLHQAAQQGHVLVINLLLKNKADPNGVTNNGQTALAIASKLGYISIVEELKVVTDTNIATTSVNIEQEYKLVVPETMQETFTSNFEDEGGEDPILGHQQQYQSMTVDDMKSVADDGKSNHRSSMAPTNISDDMTSAHANQLYSLNPSAVPDNVDINRQPITDGFLVSFLVDARGGAMRGCRHSGVRVIVPPGCAASPTCITCRYVCPQLITIPPPLMESEALASRVLELEPVGAKFLGPVILEIPHFASLRGKQREIIVLRSDNGETWGEHTLEFSKEAIQDVLNHSFEGEELNQIEDQHTNQITRILTNDFPQYFAIVSRVRLELHVIGPEGGTISSSAVPMVQAVFPQNALTKRIRVGLQAQAMEPELVVKLLGHGVAVSPVVTLQPRRRKYHKGIILRIPAPRAHSQGMINQYSGSAPTLRLLCSITGGQNKAVWEDVTGSTPLSLVKDRVSFRTTVSARFWLMDCRSVSESARMATELYTHPAHVPFMAKFVLFAKRISFLEAKVRVFCMIDDKEDKTLEHQEHFLEIAKSRDVEVLEGKEIYIEFAGNLVPVLQSGDQPKLAFQAFRENSLEFTMRLRDAVSLFFVYHSDILLNVLVAHGEPSQTPLCTLNLVLPKDVRPET